jgi:hypothetical protein
MSKMENQMGPLPSACPEPSRWLQVAAGTESRDVSAKLLEHAAGCAVCASQLREAIWIMADEEEPVENGFVMQLKSSRPDWEKDLAQRLSSVAAPSRAEHRGRRMTWFQWRFAVPLAAAALVLVSIALLISRRPVPPSAAQMPPARPPSLAEAPIPAHSTSSKTSPAAAPAPELAIASITLEPETTRGSERVAQLELTAGIRAVAVTLLFSDPPARHLSLKLVDSTDREIWTDEVEMTSRDISRDRLSVSVPAARLAADDYRIFADHVTSEGPKRVYYAFRVVR